MKLLIILSKGPRVDCIWPACLEPSRIDAPEVFAISGHSVLRGASFNEVEELANRVDKATEKSSQPCRTWQLRKPTSAPQRSAWARTDALEHERVHIVYVPHYRVADCNCYICLIVLSEGRDGRVHRGSVACT